MTDTLRSKLIRATTECGIAPEVAVALVEMLMPIIRKHAVQVADIPMFGPVISGERLTQAYISKLLGRME